MITQRSSQQKSLTGIEFDEGQMSVVHIVRSGQKFKIKNKQTVSLSLDPFTGDPELAGQEIRNHLDLLGVSEKHCLVCLPLHRVMSATVDCPELSAGDKEAYINLQVEKEFPFPVSDLAFSLSHFRSLKEREYVTIAAVPSNLIYALQKTLKSAKLKPQSVTISLTSLHDIQSKQGSIILQVKKKKIDFLIHSGGGAVTIRNIENDTSGQDIDAVEKAQNIAREIRITIGQISEDIRDSISTIKLYGSNEQIDPIFDPLKHFLQDLNLRVDYGHPQDRLKHYTFDTSEESFIPLVCTVCRFLSDQKNEYEFLPPQISRLKQITDRISSKGTLVIGGTAAACILFVTLSFVYQHFRLSNLESAWTAIEEKVGQVETLQENVKKYRGWYSNSVVSLSVLKNLTEAFPVEGSVWTKTIEIDNQSTVTCTGFAASNKDWLDMVARLNENPQVFDFQTQRTQGSRPMQFAFNYRWLEGAND